MRPRVQEELDQMESISIISWAEEPIKWCVGMVAIPKKNGKLCICVDLKHSYEAVVKEVHLLLKGMKHLLSFQVSPFLAP